jgi:nucleotidyltransferase/DNA polymerase involved in DNA repair
MLCGLRSASNAPLQLTGEHISDAKKKCPSIHLVSRMCLRLLLARRSIRLTSVVVKPHVDTLGENRRPGEPFDRTHQKAILRRYRVASREIFAVLGRFASVIEKASIDEAFIDITDLAIKRLADTVSPRDEGGGQHIH